MSDLPEVLAVIEEEAAKVQAPRDLALAVGRRLAGVSVKMPSQRTINNLQRDKIIRREFDGRNARELALRFGITVRRVYQIIGR